MSTQPGQGRGGSFRRGWRLTLGVVFLMSGPGGLRAEPWWNPDWTRRVPVTLEDPRAALSPDGILLLSEPSPLWLYNTAPCADGLADLRAVDSEGREWPAGVLNFGQDDGSSCIWVKRPEAESTVGFETPADPSAPAVITLYYGNSVAKPAAVRPPACTPLRLGLSALDNGYRAPSQVRAGPEDVKPGLALAPDGANAFFESVVLLEAEDMRRPDGQGATTLNGKETWYLRPKDPMASDGAYLASEKLWGPAEASTPYPVTCCATVQVPGAGTWMAHIRYRVATKSADGKTVLNRAGPFSVRMGDVERHCGTNQTAGAVFRYESFPVSLSAGPTEVALRFDGPAGVDAVLLSRDVRYRPDIADVNGPVWMRFRVRGPDLPPFHVQLFCMDRPMTQQGAQGKTAAWLFRTGPVSSAAEYGVALRDPDQFLRAGEWSPWARALHSEQPTWWSQVKVQTADTVERNLSLVGVGVDCDFATRPDPRRIFRAETGLVTGAQGVFVHMPTRLTLGDLREQALSYEAWARRRFEFAARLNRTTSEAPREIVLATMGWAESVLETDFMLKTFRLLGFNVIDIPTPLGPDLFWRLAESNGLESCIGQTWLPGGGVVAAAELLKPLRRPPAPGEDCGQAVRGRFEAEARRYYSPDGPRWQPALAPRCRLMIMGDEIAPSTDGVFINRLPLVKGWFHAYLREHGQTPELFGKSSWAQVDATGDRSIPAGSELDQTLALIDPALKATNFWSRDAAANATTVTGLQRVTLSVASEELLAEEEQRKPVEMAAAPATPDDKRRYYWTQRFRSYYTACFYAACTKAVDETAAAGHFRRPPKASPNFQAEPLWTGRMWSGGLNLFEWGRMNATHFMLMEDWNWDPYKVAWGMTLLRGAARKNGQELGALLVGSGVTQRYLMDLGNGVRGVLAYLYGPQQRIGPPWGDRPETYREWADLSRMTARHERDILAATNRPAGAAILVDNTADINSLYVNTAFNTAPLFERVGLFVALMDAGVPVEVVGAEEVLEDGALDRYKALYVADPHVDQKVQERIREWVKAGGVLWASYAAAGRQEYDEPSSILDSVFGLVASRPALTNTPRQWKTEDEPEIRLSPDEGMPGVSFRSVPLKPAWSLGAGVDVLGRFADGSPAFIRNRYGKGQAFLLASVAWRLAGGTSSRTAEPPGAAACRAVVAVAARVAGVQPHLRFSHARVLGFVHDGPRQAVVYLANGFDQALPDLRVEVRLPRRPVSASFGRGGPAAFEWLDEGWARVTCPLALVGGEMIVFQFEDEAASEQKGTGQ